MRELIFAYPGTAWVSLLAAGILIGALAGLLGVGGGIVAVPVLMEVFEFAGPEAIPLAVGTAQANVPVVSLSAARAHWRAVGLLAGLVPGSLAPAKVLTGAFAAIAAFLVLETAFGPRLVLFHRLPMGILAPVPPIPVGGLAAALGVGAGTLSTPALSLFSFPIRRGIGAGALFNVVVAVPATPAFLAQGWGSPGRPVDAIGNVALSCTLALSLPALFVAPVAARWSIRVPVMLLRQGFALCLCTIAVRILMRP